MLGMLLPLGIEKGKELQARRRNPDGTQAAATEAHAWLINGIMMMFECYYPDGKWGYSHFVYRSKN